MNPTIKARIESIRRGEVPEGYKRTKVGIVPNEWKEYKFFMIFKIHSSKQYQINKLQYHSEGKYPVVDQGKEFIAGYYNDDKKVIKCPPEGIIVFGDHTREIKLIKFDFIVGADGTQLLTSSGESILTCFLYYLLLNMNIPNGGYSRHLKYLKEANYFIPSLPEQTAIAEILSKQDRIIELKEKLLAEKQKQKKYLMQQLLTGKKRLPGFSGEWKKVRLSELGNCIRGVSYDPQKDLLEGKESRKIQLLRANNINSGEVNYRDVYFVNEQIVANEKIIRNGDILISMSSGSKTVVGKAAQITKIEKSSCVGAFCAIYRSIYNDYIIQLFSSELYRKQLRLLLEGSNINNLNNSDIENLCFLFPTDEKEQTAITEVLSAADKEIELLKKDVEQEKLKKKSLMQLLLTGIVRVSA